MKAKIKKLFTSTRIIILLVLLLLAVFVIHPKSSEDGVAIRSVARNSAAAYSGFISPLALDKPVYKEIIYEINGKPISNYVSYNKAVSDLQPEDLVSIKTRTHFDIDPNGNRKFYFFAKEREYTLLVRPAYKITPLNETEKIIVNQTVFFNETINGTVVESSKIVQKEIEVQKVLNETIGIEELGLSIYDAPSNNLKKGLDLEGGTRVLLKTEKTVTEEEISIIIDNLKQRLNVYGLSDLIIRSAGDFSTGNQYIVVEIAGVTEDDIKELIAKQGVFEAKVSNKTVFMGGKDIKNVCRTPDCSFVVDPRSPCGKVGSGDYQCTFSFSITLSQESAQKQADATKTLDIIDGDYLSENIDFFLDGELVDSLRIGSSLKGKAETNIAISGPGAGRTQQEAIANSGKNMKRLQTILITGSLPVKLEIVKIDTLSPLLGKELTQNAIRIALFSILAVAVVIYIRYRKLTISIPMVITMASEIILILAFAALVGWNLDLAAIAAIIVSVGTGVDDQIVITEEALLKQKESYSNWKDKLKKAFFIIMAAYFTTVVAMIPLWSAGAGLLRGFAITTIAGVTFGVFITRPAFAAMLEILFEEKE
ncbi:hypothetical protein HZA96_04525 [Candidatus Woesearchaeota archaeon]|nr:hypothetical protein [Candidatus Woesearchaeota archaeon]